MSFKVYRNESDPFEQFGDDDRFDIIEGGVLKIHRQDGTITYINPASWASIDDSPALSVYGSPANSQLRRRPPGRAALLITTRTTLPVMPQIDIDYAGWSKSPPRDEMRGRAARAHR